MSMARCRIALGWALCRSNSATNASQTEASLPGVAKRNPLGHKISKHCQVIVTFAPVHLVGNHQNHGVEAQSRMCRLHVGEAHPRHPRVGLAEDLAGTLQGHLSHQGHCEGLELLGEVLAATLPGRGHTVHLAVVATASSRQRTDDHALLVEDVEVPPLHRLDMVVASHRGPGSVALLRPQSSGLLNLQYEDRGTCLKPRLSHTPSFAKPQQLSKRLLRCHRQSSSCGRQAPPFPLEIARNHYL